MFTQVFQNHLSLTYGYSPQNRKDEQSELHFYVERYGHEPTLVVAYVPKHGTASTSDRQF